MVPSTYISDHIQTLFKKYNIQNADVILYQKLIKMSDEDIAAMDYGIIALDEYHHDTSKVWGEKVRKLIDAHPESIIFGTSATPIRTDGINTIDELFEGNCASDLPLSESIAKKIVPLPKYVGVLYTLDDELEKLRQKVDGYMSSEFTVIKGNADTADTNRIMRTIAFHDCWKRQYHNSVIQAIEKNKDIKMSDYSQENLMKISLSGIKYINSIREIRRENERVGTDYVQTLEEVQIAFQLIDAIFTVCGYLTLKNFVTTFPIEKYYKGAKWEEKDYFYTMDVLKKMDWDKPIGRDELSELLWDYENEELRHGVIIWGFRHLQKIKKQES